MNKLNAWHSVGHELVARALGFPRAAIGLLDKGADALLQEFPGRHADLPALALGGIAAELIQTGARTPADAAERWAGDRELFQKLLRLTGREEEGLEPALGRAGRLLWERRAELRKVAESRGNDLERRAAFHEAGHAVVAHRLGLPVTRVALDGQGGGECDHRPGGTFNDLAVIACAGPAAELAALGRPADLERWRADHDLVSELGQIVGWRPEDFQACIDRAARLVKDGRSDIAWLARCLRRDRVLEGADLYRALNGAAESGRKSAASDLGALKDSEA